MCSPWRIIKRSCYILQPQLVTLCLPSFPARRLLLVRNLDTLPQALDDEGLACGALVDVPDVVGGALEVAGGVVALGDENVVLGAVIDRLVDGNGGTLVYVSRSIPGKARARHEASYHELLLDRAEAVEAGLQLEVVVGSSLGDGGDDGDPVALGADVMGGRDAGDVNI